MSEFPIWAEDSEAYSILSENDLRPKEVQLRNKWFKVFASHDVEECVAKNNGCECVVNHPDILTEAPANSQFFVIPRTVLDKIGVNYFQDDQGEVCEEPHIDKTLNPEWEILHDCIPCFLVPCI